MSDTSNKAPEPQARATDPLVSRSARLSGVRSNPPAGSPSTPRLEARAPLSPPTRFTLTVIFFVIVSAVFSWPLILFRDDVFYTRQFDLYGVLWMAEHVMHLFSGLNVPFANYPLGENVSRPDAFVFLGVAALVHGWMSPRILVACYILVGPIVGALAAERCAARGLGVRFPWSLLAGLVYGFNGLAATGWLEGHVYFLFNPWLPLLLLALLKASVPGAPAREGFKAGLWWSLGLLTSAYIGIFGAFLILVMALRALRMGGLGRRVARNFGALALIALPVGVVHAWIFFAGSGQRAPELWRVTRTSSATLAGLATWWPDVDMKTYHSIATPLGFGTLALLLFAPLILRRTRGWRTLALLAAMAVFLSLGTAVQLGMGSPSSWSTPMALLEKTPILVFFHFPVRFLWIYYLCGGLVAALAADALARHVGFFPTLPLLLVVALDATLGTGAPLRNQPVLATLPSAYRVAPEGRAVLDLFAEQPIVLGDITTFVTKLTTYYQTLHHRKVLAAALPTHGQNCRDTVGRFVISRLMDLKRAEATGEADDAHDVRDLLMDLGIGAVAVHADLFTETDRAVVLEGMVAVAGQPAATSNDGGETIVLFVLPEKQGIDPLAAYQRFLKKP